MLSSVYTAIFYLAALPCAVAASSVLYEPTTGDFWISGTQQPDGHAALFLYSASGQLAMASPPLVAAYPLSNEVWLGKEVSLSLPRDYIDPLYIGPFANPGTSIGDLSARFVFLSFSRRLYFEQPVPIRLVPEPRTFWLFALGAGLGLCTLRPAKRKMFVCFFGCVF